MTRVRVPRSSTLASYVPQLVLRTLMGGAPTEPHAEAFPAALLMIDISGFTAITDAATRRGPAGAEELSRSLNAYIGAIIDVVVEHGGDVAKVVGDALIPVWPTTEDELPDTTVRAAACGLAIASHLGESRMGTDLELSLKVGLCAGAVASTHVGGLDGRWLFLVSGDAVSQLTALQPELRTGQVVASPQAWALVSERSTGQDSAGGHVQIGAIPTRSRRVRRSR